MIRNFESFNLSIIIIFDLFDLYLLVLIHFRVHINKSQLVFRQSQKLFNNKFDSNMKLFSFSLAFLAISAETEVIFSLFLTTTNHECLGKSNQSWSIFSSGRKSPTLFWFGLVQIQKTSL